MGSSYFGEPKMLGGNERGSSSSPNSSSSSRRGKKNNSEKPRQPQRGLGVAQLEKIRLHTQMAYAYHPTATLHASNYPSNFNNNEDPRVQMAYSSPSSSSSFSYPSSSTSYSPSYGFQPNIMMGGIAEYDEKTNMRSFGDYRSSTNTARLEHDNAILDNQCSAHSNITIPFLNLYDSHGIDINKKHRSTGSLGSSSHYSESSDTQDLDLELRLSL